jgi:hypothetical protein
MYVIKRYYSRIASSWIFLLYVPKNCQKELLLVEICFKVNKN